MFYLVNGNYWYTPVYKENVSHFLESAHAFASYESAKAEQGVQVAKYNRHFFIVRIEFV